MAVQIREYNRNVVVVGKTGAGKSTVSNAIIGRDVFKVGSSVGSVTTRSSHSQVRLPDPDDNCAYIIKMIDTVGLFDTGVRTNQETIDELKSFFRDVIPEGVCLILFVFKEGRFTSEERATFEFIIKNFSQEISSISALVITSCDTKSDKKREELVTDFKTNGVTKGIAKFMQKGIFPVGFPNLDEYDDDDPMREVFAKKIEKDKKTLLSLTKEAGEMKLSKELFQKSFWSKCTIL